VLGVGRDADARTIKDAFRTLALRYHPDRNKEPGAEERFKEIAEAYVVLSDPRKRAEYDARGFEGVAGFSPEDLFGGINFEDLFGGLGFDFGGETLFDHLFRRGRHAGPRRGANLEVTLEVPLERVASGGETSVSVRRPEVCPVCRGTRAKAGTKPRPCSACRGTGRHVVTRRQAGITLQQVTACATCGGEGTVIDELCTQCHGIGRSERLETLAVRIPVGVEEGMALRVAGHGLPSSEATGRPGDLFVVVHSAPDPRFERRGADLWRTEAVHVADAVLGTTLEVPTLEGPVKVVVPPGTQPDSILRLRGKGLPEFGGTRSGALYIRVHVPLPEQLSTEERKLYERLRALAGKSATNRRIPRPSGQRSERRG
jgi:molecular chaperone DnaJ